MAHIHKNILAKRGGTLADSGRYVADTGRTLAENGGYVADSGRRSSGARHSE